MDNEFLSPSEITAAAQNPIMQRIVAVLEACAGTRTPVTVKYLVEVTGLAKSTVHRMCWKLEQVGLLDHGEDGFSIGTKLFALANANPAVTRIRAAAIPRLVDLQQLAGASHLGILSGGRALVVDGLYTASMRAATLIGAGLPLHCTAVGKAMLSVLELPERERLLGRGPLPAATSRSIVQPGLLRSHLDQASVQGFAISREEFQPGVIGVAAPFRAAGMVCALACIGNSTDQRVQRAAPHVVAAALGLQSQLDPDHLLAARSQS